MRCEVVQATLDHAADLAPRLRKADLVEVEAFGSTPLQSLTRALAAPGNSYAGLVDGRVVCIFGAVSATLCSDAAVPWLLGSSEMVRHAPTFLRLNRAYMALLRSRYRLLHNFVWAGNTAAIRWLGWLGFTVHEPLHYPGDPAVPMRYFELTRHV